MVPDRRDLLAELLVRLPQVHEGRHEQGDHADDDEYRGGDAADGRTQLSHDPGSGAHGRLHLPDGSRELHEALHGHADLGYRGADDDEERPDGGHQQGDADDHLPLAVVHAVQLVDEGLNLGDDVADGGHQDVAEGYGQLLQLRLQDRQLAGEVVLHDTGHLLGGAVAVVDGALELRDVLRSRVHEREEAGHGVLADQRLGCLRLFRLRHLGEGDAAVGEDVVQVPHGAVCVRRLDGHVAEGRAGELQVALQLGHDGAKRGTGLAALDSGVRHEADGLRRVLCGVPHSTRDGGAVPEGLAHHGHVGVRVRRGSGEDVGEMAGVLRGEPEGGQGVRHDVGGGCEVFAGGGGEVHDALDAVQHVLGLPACHRHVVHGLGCLGCGELGLRAHLASLLAQGVEVVTGGTGYRRHLTHGGSRSPQPS